MKIEFILILVLVICCPAIATEYKVYINEFFKVEYPTDWVIQEPLRNIKGDYQGTAFGSRLAATAYRLPQDLNQAFCRLEVKGQSDINNPIRTNEKVMVTVHVEGSTISIELPGSSKSFDMFNETGYIDDPLLVGLNKTDVMNNPLLHFLSTFRVNQPNLNEVPIGKLPYNNEQIDRS